MWSEPEEGHGGERRWKDGTLRALALPWDAAFAMRGRLAPAAAPRWSSPGGLGVLVVAPHPDDEVAGCGGTLLLHRGRGDDVTVAHVTDGRRSRALGLGPAEMSRRRREEADRAAGILDVSLAWLGLPEGEWREHELTPRLADLLRATSPDLIYAPSRVDFHPEHRRVAAALGHALAGVPGTPLVRVYEMHVPLTSVLVGRVAPTATVAARCRAALNAYRTQLGSLRRTARMKRYAGRRHRAGAEAESFWEMPAAAYVRLHALAENDAYGAAFRGVRRLPLTDPLSYLSGRARRRRLAAAIEGARP